MQDVVQQTEEERWMWPVGRVCCEARKEGTKGKDDLLKLLYAVFRVQLDAEVSRVEEYTYA